MHDILSIESIYLNKDGNIVVKAVLENITYIKGSQTHLDPPEFAPCLCETVIYSDGLPPEVTLVDNEEDLEELINRFNLLSNQSWTPIIEDNSDLDVDYEATNSRLFF